MASRQQHGRPYGVHENYIRPRRLVSPRRGQGLLALRSSYNRVFPISLPVTLRLRPGYSGGAAWILPNSLSSTPSYLLAHYMRNGIKCQVLYDNLGQFPEPRQNRQFFVNCCYISKTTTSSSKSAPYAYCERSACAVLLNFKLLRGCGIVSLNRVSLRCCKCCAACLSAQLPPLLSLRAEVRRLPAAYPLR